MKNGSRGEGMSLAPAGRSRAAVCQPADGRRSGWLWRRGIPLIAGLSALAAVAAGADWLWEFGVVAAQSGDGDPEELAVLVAASVLSLCLMACWRIASPQGGPALSAEVAPATGGRSARSEVVLAAVVTAVGVAAPLYSLDLPLRFDESITVDFASQPFGTVVSRYYTTNNHVLHSLLVWVVHQFGDWSRIAWRLPAFFSFCLLLPALWWFVRREYGPTAAAFATAFLASTPFLFKFATNARGYTLLLLLFVGALLCGQSLVRRPERRGLWAAWAATIGLGFFTIPLMVFPAATTAIWMVLARWRRCGREGMGSFAFKTAGWSAAALVFAGALYAPIVATTGIDHLQIALSGIGLEEAALPKMLWYPVVVWRQWHWTSPAWVQGLLLALVFVGVALPARTCGRAGTLFLAMIAATAAVALAKPVVYSPRMGIWALLVLMTLAGVGAGTVFQGLAARAESRWPGLATPSREGRGRVATWGAVLLVLALAVKSVVQLGAARRHGLDLQEPGVPTTVFSVAEEIRVGDYFTIHRNRALSTVVHMRSLHRVDMNAGWYNPSGRLRRPWPVHRVSASPGGPPSGASSSGPVENVAQGRLFVVTEGEATAVREFMAAGGPSHELAAAFDDGSVYVLDEWTGPVTPVTEISAQTKPIHLLDDQASLRTPRSP